MRIGMSLTSSYSRRDDSKQLMDNLIARVELMAELGFDSLSLGDHHITHDHYFQVLPTMCRMSAHSGNMQLIPLFSLPGRAWRSGREYASCPCAAWPLDNGYSHPGCRQSAMYPWPLRQSLGSRVQTADSPHCAPARARLTNEYHAAKSPLQPDPDGLARLRLRGIAAAFPPPYPASTPG